ncbi:hypothetical protein [Persicobacter diffluens]|uniref:Lipoprotein n=1 Tax=Persicobacter diffluens TaxID=981 RepID=A0AAN4W4D1_9BACT|nr:hypothetical protein PEDI_46190 [Persicobacter diffluens]
MRKFLWPLSLIMACFVLFACQEEEVQPLEPNPNAGMTLRTILKEPAKLQEKIEVMSPIDDEATQQMILELKEGNAVIERASKYLNPTGEVMTSVEKMGDRPTEGPVFIYQFSVDVGEGEFQNVAYQVSSNAEVFYHDVYSVEGGLILSGKETKEAKNKMGEIVFGTDTIKWSQDSRNNLHYQIGYVPEPVSGRVQVAYKQQEVTSAYDGVHDVVIKEDSKKRYAFDINVLGTGGKLVAYKENGEDVDYDGVWPTPPPPEDFTPVRMAFIGEHLSKAHVAAVEMQKNQNDGTMGVVWGNVNFMTGTLNVINYYFNPPAEADTTHTNIVGDEWCLVYTWENTALGEMVGYQISSTYTDYVHQVFTKPIEGGGWKPLYFGMQGREVNNGYVDVATDGVFPEQTNPKRFAYSMNGDQGSFTFLTKRGSGHVELRTFKNAAPDFDVDFSSYQKAEGAIDKEFYDLVPSDLNNWMDAELNDGGSSGFWKNYPQNKEGTW